MTTDSQNETLSKRRPSSPNIKAPLILTHACQRFSSVQKASRLPHGRNSVRCPAPVTQNNVWDLECPQSATPWTRLKKQAWRTDTTRPSEETNPLLTFCASLRSRNAHGHLTRELLCENLQWKSHRPDGAPWSNPGPLASTVRTLYIAWGIKTNSRLRRSPHSLKSKESSLSR